MALRKRELIVYKCDDPRCAVEFLADEEFNPVLEKGHHVPHQCARCKLWFCYQHVFEFCCDSRVIGQLCIDCAPLLYNVFGEGWLRDG